MLLSSHNTQIFFNHEKKEEKNVKLIIFGFEKIEVCW